MIPKLVYTHITNNKAHLAHLFCENVCVCVCVCFYLWCIFLKSVQDNVDNGDDLVNSIWIQKIKANVEQIWTNHRGWLWNFLIEFLWLVHNLGHQNWRPQYDDYGDDELTHTLRWLKQPQYWTTPSLVCPKNVQKGDFYAKKESISN